MKGKKTRDVEVCGTPTRWIHEALGTHDEKNCEQDELRVMSNMFPESAGTKSCHLYDMIYLRDVIMRNRSSEPATRGATVDPNVVILMRASFQPGNQVAGMDFDYQIMIAFLPGTGSFYCARERRC